MSGEYIPATRENDMMLKSYKVYIVNFPASLYNFEAKKQYMYIHIYTAS